MGKYIVSGSNDNTIKIWNFETKAEIRTLTGHRDTIRSVAISSDSSSIVSASFDSTIRIWNLEKNRSEISVSTNNFTDKGKLIHA